MNDISYDLIEKLRETGSGRAAEEEILRTSEDPAYLFALSESRANLIGWYPFRKDMKVLVIGADYGAETEAIATRVAELHILSGRAEAREVIRFRHPAYLAENGGNVSLLQTAKKGAYDLVYLPVLSEDVFADLLPAEDGMRTAANGETDRPGLSARTGSLPALLKEAASCLLPGGTLILAADNADALSLKTGAEPSKDRLYTTQKKLSELLAALPFSRSRFYYPLPDPWFSRDIYSEQYLPQEGDFRGISETYEAPRYQSCDEEAFYGQLCALSVFPPFAPGYLVIAGGYESADAALPAEIYIRFNRTRLPQYRTKTTILEENGTRVVKKTALSKAANDHILSLDKKYRILLNDQGSKLLVQEPALAMEAGGLYSASFPYLNGTTLSKLLSAEIRDGKAPLARIREALELVLGVGAHECRNMDCLFENVMKCGEQYYYLDYEWVFDEALDRGYLRYRILRYWFEAYRESLFAYADLYDFLSCFGVDQASFADYERMEASFQEFVHGAGPALRDAYRQPSVNIRDFRKTEDKLKEYTDWNLRLQDEVEEHKETIEKQTEEMRLTQNHVRNIEAANRIHERDIAQLSAELSYLRRHESLPSRAYRAFSAAFEHAFPKGSRKRKVLHYLKQTARHPLASFGQYLTEEGRNRIAGDFAIGGEYGEGGRLQLPDCLHYADLFKSTAQDSGSQNGESAKKRPRVSIVIPVYNQIAYTYACVRSIIEHTDFTETPYEVILADDVSTDATASVGKYIRGLVIARNESNQGFLRNCNQAAKKALGEYIFFLNNDTKVKDGWLSSLVDLMDQDETIGMCGSKLVYPDGRLQEAGGIIWSDASGWNYGRLDDPAKPQYNYVKEVDYISGAAIMIRHALWKEIGGFDERFAPAYCEDSDLAFEVRRHGKRVVYQPLSEVVHFEGISNGTDVNGTGLKRYQVENQKKFREKWKDALLNQSKNDGNPNPFAARDRSQRKPCILVIDHYVPTWDRDAGSRTTYQYLKLFLKKGYNVKFLGDNFLHEEPYSTELLQMGVEILYGETMQQGIWDWIRDNRDFIDIAYLNRPHIAVKYIDFLRKYTDIKCVYYGHDLHFMRILREYELTGDIRKKRESDYWKSIELSVMRKCDASYYPSEEEVRAVKAVDPSIPVKALIAYVWDDVGAADRSKESQRTETAGSIEASLETREGLLFVGGFAHPPNEDGVLWFAKEIFPALREQIPGITLDVVGSHATEAVEALGEAPEESGIRVRGFVSDEELAALYHKTRLVVVPLRYGAGVKGKVVEAIHEGAVVVTTSVGAEGIPEAARVMAVVNESDEDLIERPQEVAERFAAAVTCLYPDTERCAAIRRETAAYIREHYSTEAAWRKIAPDFRPGRGNR